MLGVLGELADRDGRWVVVLPEWVGPADREVRRLVSAVHDETGRFPGVLALTPGDGERLVHRVMSIADEYVGLLVVGCWNRSRVLPALVVCAESLGLPVVEVLAGPYVSRWYAPSLHQWVSPRVPPPETPVIGGDPSGGPLPWHQWEAATWPNPALRNHQVRVTELSEPGGRRAYGIGPGTVYLSGPMRGYPNLNVDQFESAARWIKDTFGWGVISPAEADKLRLERFFGLYGRRAGTTGEEIPGVLRSMLEWDLHQVLHADGVVVFGDWRRSRGATAEVATALAVDRPVLEIRRVGHTWAVTSHWDPARKTWSVAEPYRWPDLAGETGNEP